MERSILVIDSDKRSVESLIRCGKKDFSFVRATNVVDAYKVIDSIECAAVIVDPDNCDSGDCFEFVCALKNTKHESQSPFVIVWSKNVRPEIAVHCWSIGVDEYVRKPFDPFVILNFLDNKTYLD